MNNVMYIIELMSMYMHNVHCMCTVDVCHSALCIQSSAYRASNYICDAH